MGRRYFYAIVDETNSQLERQRTHNPGSWDGYDTNPWYQSARRKTGRR